MMFHTDHSITESLANFNKVNLKVNKVKESFLEASEEELVWEKDEEYSPSGLLSPY